MCLQVLTESNKSRFDSYSRQEQCINHIPYYLSGLSYAHFFRQPFAKQLYLHHVLFLCFLWTTAKSESQSRGYFTGCGYNQLFFVLSSNDPPHKWLLRTKPHSFPFVFGVLRTNQSCIQKLTVTLVFVGKVRQSWA